MNRDDIIRMTREADEYADKHTPQYVTLPNEWSVIRDERFAHLVAEYEREVCAKMCEKFPYDCLGCLDDCAAAIRARSKT